MANPLTQKLSSFVALSTADRCMLDDLASARSSQPRMTTLIRSGERPEHVFLLIRGWAYRYVALPNGARQITSIFMPGDLCDARTLFLDRVDHSIGLLSDAMVATIRRSELERALEHHPAIGHALYCSTLADEAIVSHWLANVSRRQAYSRIAHLFCELWERARQLGLIKANALVLPLTQEQIGDVTGLTSVHVNRILKRMRAEGMISLERGILIIRDMNELRAAAGFNPAYLQLGRRNPS